MSAGWGIAGGVGGLLNAGTGIASPWIGLGLGLGAQKAAKSEAKKAYRRQIALRRSYWQDQVYSLKEAGLNPILGLRQGSGTPSVNSARPGAQAGELLLRGKDVAASGRLKSTQGQLVRAQLRHVNALEATERAKQLDLVASAREKHAYTNNLKARTDIEKLKEPRADVEAGIYDSWLGEAAMEIEMYNRGLGNLGTLIGLAMQLRKVPWRSLGAQGRAQLMQIEDAIRNLRRSGPRDKETGQPRSGRARTRRRERPDDTPQHWGHENERPWLKRWDGQGPIPY